MKKTSYKSYKQIEDKTIVWFEDTNNYLVLETTAASILKKIDKGVDRTQIAATLSKQTKVTLEQAKDFIIDFEKRIYHQEPFAKVDQNNHGKDVKFPTSFNSSIHYQIKNSVFKISYLSALECSYIHPKFAHLVIDTPNRADYEFDIFIQNDFIYLFVEKKLVNRWAKKDLHYFQGKLSMELLQKVHQKEEEEWLGVFHASALGDGKKAILFLGDSGNGKSTSLALLQAHGFDCIADDFVPVDKKDQHVYAFPAAISIKRNSVETLLPFYPALKKTKEYDLKELNKIVRYLVPHHKNDSTHLPCKDLVFIKYQKNATCCIDKISKTTAFMQLVPDSWLCPKKQNAKVFLDWFEHLNCYQLTYSDTNQLVKVVSKLFKEEA